MGKPAPLTEDWRVERHDHDDGVISYEIWGYLRGEYSFLFHIYEQPFVEGAEILANVVVRSVNCHHDLVEALTAASQAMDVEDWWTAQAIARNALKREADMTSPERGEP